MWLNEMLKELGIVTPKFEKKTDGSYSYDGVPFEWDRPGVGVYLPGAIRLIWRDEKGKLTYCRTATDEEVRFITLIEKLEATKAKAVKAIENESRLMREDIFEAMRRSNFDRIHSCCDPHLEKMCNEDEYAGNLEAFATHLLNVLKEKK